MIDKTATEERINQGYIERLERDNAALREALDILLSSLKWEENRSGTTYHGYEQARAALRQADQD